MFEADDKLERNNGRLADEAVLGQARSSHVRSGGWAVRLTTEGIVPVNRNETRRSDALRRGWAGQIRRSAEGGGPEAAPNEGVTGRWTGRGHFA